MIHNNDIASFIYDSSVKLRGGSFALIGKDPSSIDLVLESVVNKIYHINNFRAPSDFIFNIESNNGDISIKDIRNAHEFLKYKDQNTRLIIINHLGNAGDRAMSALLKILEDHTDNALFIVVTPSHHARFATILSRCQVLYTPFINTSPQEQTVTIYEHLLHATTPVSVDSRHIVSAIYLYSARVMKRCCSLAIDPLFANEISTLDKLTPKLKLGLFAHEIPNIVDFAHKALDMKLGPESIVISISSKLSALFH